MDWNASFQSCRWDGGNAPAQFAMSFQTSVPPEFNANCFLLFEERVVDRLRVVINERFVIDSNCSAWRRIQLELDSVQSKIARLDARRDVLLAQRREASFAAGPIADTLAKIDAELETLTAPRAAHDRERLLLEPEARKARAASWLHLGHVARRTLETAAADAATEKNKLAAALMADTGAKLSSYLDKLLMTNWLEWQLSRRREDLVNLAAAAEWCLRSSDEFFIGSLLSADEQAARLTDGPRRATKH